MKRLARASPLFAIVIGLAMLGLSVVGIVLRLWGGAARRWPMPTLILTITFAAAAAVHPYSEPIWIAGGIAFLGELVYLRKHPPVRFIEEGGVRTYFIRDEGSGLIKIGKSTNPIRRLATLQTSHHSRLRLLATTSQSEHAMHRRFRHLHQRGEWYRPGDDLIRYIDG